MSPTYRINGAMIIIDRVHFLEHKDFFSPDTLAYVMPKERSRRIQHLTLHWQKFY